MGLIDEQAVRAQLERILASAGFVQSDRLCRFLRFAVEAKLGGDGERMKEYVLGREVFDRGEDYDPRLDPIVRVEARRLRTKLAEYYGGVGRMDAVRIEVPKGGYEAAFRAREAAGFGGRWVGLLLVAVVLAGILYYTLRPGQTEMVLVMPAGWFWGETAAAEDMEKSLAESVAAEMVRTGAARVIAWPAVSRYHGEHAGNRGIGGDLGASRLLLVSVRGEPASARVTLIMMDAVGNQKFWVGDYDSQKLERAEDRMELVRRACLEFAGRRP